MKDVKFELDRKLDELGLLDPLISTTTDLLISAPSCPAVLSCPVLFCPLSSLREEQESLSRLVSVAGVTMLYGPVILHGLVWRQRRTKDGHAERIRLVTAHCCGGTQRGLLTASKLPLCL